MLPGSSELAVIFHGAHMRAGLWLEHKAFVERGWSVLQPSRPGYGRTPPGADRELGPFVDQVATLVKELGYRRVCAAGTSAGGRSAITFAARHPDLVSSVVLQSAVSFGDWPDRLMEVTSKLSLNPLIEPLTWGFIHQMFRWRPEWMLRKLLGPMSKRPIAQVIGEYSEAERAELFELFKRMRSGSGFMRDLWSYEDVTAEVAQPTLIVCGENDEVVPISHSEALRASIANSALVVTPTSSHMMWVGPGKEEVHKAVSDFLSVVTP